MRLIQKTIVKNEIAKMFKALSPGQALRHQEMIMSNPKIMENFYWYEYTKSNHKTVPYLRRLCKEVTKDPKYGVRYISAMKVIVKVGKTYKKFWAWGYPDASQAKVVLMEYDSKSGGIVRAQTDKAGHLGRPVESVVTQKALDEAKEGDEVAKAESEEKEEEVEAKAESEDESDADS